MRIRDEIVHKLILKKSFSHYPEDKYFIKEIMKFSKEKKPKVLDVGCGIGHYSFLFENEGANVVAFDYNKDLIEKGKRKKADLGSNVKFIIADGNYPDKYFNEEEFDIVFMSGFSLFARSLKQELMERYLSLLKGGGGKLTFIQNSNLTGVVRRTHIKNYSIDELRSFFESLNCNVEKVYFYDRHIIGRFLRSFVFNRSSTKMHISISKITKLPCNIVFIVSKGYSD
jgi:ubiquinone/menaquinone biosynthesis C-methylase UbiE